MFDVGWSEFMLVVLLAIVMMGPKDIPEIIYNFGRIVRRIQYFKFAMTRQFDGFMEQMDLHELKKGALGDMAPRNLTKNLMTPLPEQNGANPATPAPERTVTTEPAHEADDDEAYHAEFPIPVMPAAAPESESDDDHSRKSEPIAR